MEDEITVLPNGFRYFFFGPEGEMVEFFKEHNRTRLIAVSGFIERGKPAAVFR